MNWSDLPVLLAVAETGSFSAAARKLRLSQPTVGRRIAALEEQFGKALLTSNGKALELTATGRKVIEHARRMDDEAAAIMREVESEDDSLSGPVTISATQGVGDYWLPRVMAELCAEHPTLEIRVDVSPQAANLARREADIALRWMGPGNQNSLIGRKVIEAGFGLYASPSYLQSHGRPLAVADLSDHQMVEMQFTNGNRAWDPNEKMPAGARHPRISFSSNSFHAHETAILSGFGIGPLAHAQAAWVPGIERVIPDYENMEELWIVAHEDLMRSPRIRTVFDYLIEALRTDSEYFISGNPGRWKDDILAHRLHG